MKRISSGGVETLLITALLGLVMLGCDSVSADHPERMQFDAEVQMAVLNGPPTYILNRLDSNASYYPINLPAEFRQETKRVRVDGFVIKDYKVLLMPPIEISTIVELPSGGA